MRDHSPHETIAAFGHAIGESDLAQKLHHHRQQHQLPNGELLRKIATQLDAEGVAGLVEALARDGQLPGYTEDATAVIDEIVCGLAELDDHDGRDRRMALLLLDSDPQVPGDRRES